LLQTDLAGLRHGVSAQQRFGGKGCPSASRDSDPLGESRQSGKITMPIQVHQDGVKIDHIHGAAVCEEIGERLSVALGPQSNELPARLLTLIDQLAKVEPREALSELRRDLSA
jgi:hypothetical protein